jgi:phosphomannomutase
MVTASHNPADYNGMKLVREKSIPLTGEDLLADMERMIVTHQIPEAIGIEGNLTKLDNRPAYIEKLLSFIDVTKLKPLKVVCNPGNGCAGPTMRALENHLPLKLDFIHETPDGTFPHGVPNPLLSENRHITAARVRETGADLAIAWDGDFDRCFFFDETGRFVEGYYLVALLARTILRHHPGQKIIHDPRLYWNTNDVVCCAGGEAIMSRTGHAFIKQTMRKEDAIYGGEMSAHHYFRDFSYCDSGMIPWLLVVEEISRSGKPLSRLVNEMIANYPVSGEINRRVEDAKAVVAKVREHFEDEKISEDQTDGLSFEMKNWRFNLRSSNTEPLLRLNVESRKDRMLMEERTAEILKIIDA